MIQKRSNNIIQRHLTTTSWSPETPNTPRDGHNTTQHVSKQNKNMTNCWPKMSPHWLMKYVKHRKHKWNPNDTKIIENETRMTPKYSFVTLVIGNYILGTEHGTIFELLWNHRHDMIPLVAEWTISRCKPFERYFQASDTKLIVQEQTKRGLSSLLPANPPVNPNRGNLTPPPHSCT